MSDTKLSRDYIAENGIAEDINTLINSKVTDGSMIMMFTDRFECSHQKEIQDTSHLLEVRVFTKNAELKIMRPTIADQFRYRFIDDSTGKNDYIEEKHYLDIDSNKSDGFDYTATGGGKYTLPVENAEKVLIRNYISYDEQGIAHITDYRVVEYLCKEV